MATLTQELRLSHHQGYNLEASRASAQMSFGFPIKIYSLTESIVSRVSAQPPQGYNLEASGAAVQLPPRTFQGLRLSSNSQILKHVVLD